MGSIKITGFDKLEKKLNIAKNSINDVDGNMNIKVNLIKANLVFFNSKYNTNFNSKSTKEDFIKYFGTQYRNFIGKNIFTTVDAKKEFNSYYQDYAQIV